MAETWQYSSFYGLPVYLFATGLWIYPAWASNSYGAGFAFNFFTTKPTSMNSELIIMTDVLDILFEKRNKAYGAYTLRKFYNGRLIKSMGVMTLIVLLFSAFTLLPDKEVKNDQFEVQEQFFGQAPPPPKAAEPKPPVSKPTVTPPISAVKLLTRIVFVNKADTADLLQDIKDNMAIGSNTHILSGESGIQIIAPATGGEGVGEPVVAPEPVVDINQPLEVAEVMPEYPGGLEALRRFLVKNLRNPRDMEADELISVKVRFVVGFDGKLQRFELVQDGGAEFNEEVMRVLKKMPAWVPGKSKGRNVAVFYMIPVKFTGEN